MIGELISSYAKGNKMLITSYMCVVLVGVLTSFYLISKYTAQLMSSFTSGSNAKNMILAVVVAYVVSLSTEILKKYTEDTIVPSFTEHVRSHIYKAVMESHRSDRQVEMGKLFNVISYLPYVIRSATIEVIRTYLPYAVALIVLIGYFFSLDPSFGLLQVVTLCVYILTICICSKKCIESSHESYKDYMVLSESVQDKIVNIESVYAAQQENEEIKKYDEFNKENINKYRTNLRRLWRLDAYERMILVSSFVGFNYMIYKKNVPKKLAIALYVAEIYYFLRILQTTQSNVLSLFNLIGEGQAMTEFMDSLHTEYDATSDVSKKKIIKSKVTQNGPSLTIENAWFRYNYNTPYILKNFNFVAHHGDRIWIKGSSGCGKSTIFKLILGGLTLERGSIKLFGNSDPQTIRENTSLVDQHTKLFHDTVMRNIMYGNSATESEIRRVIKKLDTNIYDKLSKGLYTDAGVGGENLSGGQRQLTILLRCYFRPATIVLMDEPISRN